MVSVRELIYLQLLNLRWGLICNSIVPQLIRIGQGYRAFDPRFDVISLYIYIYKNKNIETSCKSRQRSRSRIDLSAKFEKDDLDNYRMHRDK